MRQTRLEELDLLDTWDQLGVRERRALQAIADRLLMGQKAFGELSYKKKDWLQEASEEAFDMAVYLAAKLIDDEDNQPDTERQPMAAPERNPE